MKGKRPEGEKGEPPWEMGQKSVGSGGSHGGEEGWVYEWDCGYNTGAAGSGGSRGNGG